MKKIVLSMVLCLFSINVFCAIDRSEVHYFVLACGDSETEALIYKPDNIVVRPSIRLLKMGKESFNEFQPEFKGEKVLVEERGEKNTILSRLRSETQVNNPISIERVMISSRKGSSFKISCLRIRLGKVQALILKNENSII